MARPRLSHDVAPPATALRGTSGKGARMMKSSPRLALTVWAALAVSTCLGAPSDIGANP